LKQPRSPTLASEGLGPRVAVFYAVRIFATWTCRSSVASAPARDSQWSFEAINFSNAPKFANPNGSFTSPELGFVTGAGSDSSDSAVIRQVQAGLKLSF
jgi:hypothetical protein